MIVRQFISDIQTSIKAISADSYIPPRFVFYESQNIISDFLKKDNDAKKKLSRLADGWSEIDCVELEEIPVIQCADIDVRLCDKVMKSKFKIPEIYSFSYGNIINHVASVNFSYFFDPVNPRQWNNIQKRQYKDKNKYYYFILNNYLYIPVPKGNDLPVEVVRIKAFFMDQSKVEEYKNLQDCQDCPKSSSCKSTLDYEMVIPSYLINDVKKELINRLASVYLKITPDEYANLNSIDKTNQKDIQTYEAP
jgi:hypothetical protein